MNNHTIPRLKSTGSREHGAKKNREQGAKESNLGSREQKIVGIVSKNLI